MKKFYYLIILVIVIIIVILVKNNIIILKKGKIDNLKYTVIDKEIKISSKINDYTECNNSNLSNQYSEINFNNNIYKAISSSQVNENLIDNYINKVSLTEFNEFIHAEIYTTAYIHKIKNISENVAIALKFENTNNYYTYLNSYCKPDTLKELIDMYNLDEYLSLNSITYTKNIYIHNFFEQNINLNFFNIHDTEFKNIIFSNTDISLNYNTSINLNQHFKINTISPIYGSFHIVLTRENNMIITVPAIGNSFICNIGSENYNSFYKLIKNQESKATIARIIYI